jgi:DNA polymerase-3 subunit epsilon
MQTLMNVGAPRFLKALLHRRDPDPRIRENHDYFRDFDQDIRLEDCGFTVLDTELTGMSAGKDEIVSIGAVKISDLGIKPNQGFYALVCPECELPKDSTLIHRITPEQIKSSPPISEVLPDLVEFIGSDLIVGHYVGMDMNFINRACLRHLGGELRNPCLDTLRLAKIYREESFKNHYDQFDLSVSYNLTDLAQEYGLPVFPPHNAMLDAMQAGYLFLYLVRKLRAGGIETLRDLYQAGRSWRWVL